MSTANATAPLDPARQYETRAPQIIAALVTCPAIAAILVAMRIYTRVFVVRKHFLEDYSIVAALVSTISMSVFTGLTVIYGSGRHVETVSAAELRDLSRVGIGVIQFYALTHFFLKLSIMLQYNRITILPWEKRLCFTIIALLTAGYIAILVVEMVRCVPFEAQWTPKYPGARCINSTAFYFSAQGLNLLMDVVILLGPLFILRHSSAPLQQKLLFGIALAFGGTWVLCSPACVVSILRLQTLTPSTTSPDPTWDKTPSGIYGTIEANLGISCACLVTLRPLFHRVWQTFSGAETEEPQQVEPPRYKLGRHAHPNDLTLSSLGSTALGSENPDVELLGASKELKPLASFTAKAVKEESTRLTKSAPR